METTRVAGTHRYPGEYTYKGVVYTPMFDLENLQSIEDDLQFGADDVVVATYPKSGTSWMMELVFWLRHGCEAGDARTESFHDIFPHLEMARNAMHLEPTQHDIKTHLNVSYFKRHLEDLETCPKFVVVMRDIKDLLVSYYYFHKMVRPTAFGERDFGEFFQKFKEGSLVFGDPIEYNLDWWAYKNHPNVHIVFYEDLLADGFEQIKALGEFLSCPVSDETAMRIQRGCSFHQMSQRGLHMYQKELIAHMYDELSSRFFRKGISGDWQNHLSVEQASYVDDLVRDRYQTACLDGPTQDQP